MRETIDVLGIRNGLWRLSFLGIYFTLAAITTRGWMRAPGGALDIWPLLGLHVFWALVALVYASHVNRMACAAANDRAAETYARELLRAQSARPIKALHANKTGTWDAERLPLLNPKLGVSERP